MMMTNRIITGLPKHDYFFATIICGSVLILSGLISLHIPESIISNSGAAYSFKEVLGDKVWQVIFITAGLFKIYTLSLDQHLVLKFIASFLGFFLFTWGFYSILWYGISGMNFSTSSWFVLACVDFYGFYRLTKRIE